MATATALAPAAPRRDPAWWGRVFWGSAALVVLWPLAVATEFKPWVMFDLPTERVSPALLEQLYADLEGEAQAADAPSSPNAAPGAPAPAVMHCR